MFDLSGLFQIKKKKNNLKPKNVLTEVQTFKLMDCDKAHYAKEIIQWERFLFLNTKLIRILNINQRLKFYFYNQIMHSVKRVNERRYEFGDENGAESWVCAKIPHDGAIKKDCVPKVIQNDWLIKWKKSPF